MIEITSALVLMSVVSVFSVTQYKRQKTKSLTRSAQTQLGHLYRMEKTYFAENNTFTFELKGNLFPKGKQLYNVGFGSGASDFKNNPCGDLGEAAYKNNYWELCLKTSQEGRKECWFKNKHEKNPTIIGEYQDLRSFAYHKPNQNCKPPGVPGYIPPTRVLTNKSFYCSGAKPLREFPDNENRSYPRFIAYAAGDILDPRDFKSTAEKMDVWRINGSGFLEHCQSALEELADPSGYAGTCRSKMKNNEESNDDYCV